MDSSRSIQLSNLPVVQDPKGLVELLEEITGKGTVIACKLRTPKSNKSRMYAHVQFASPDLAKLVRGLASGGLITVGQNKLTSQYLERDIVAKAKSMPTRIEEGKLYLGNLISQNVFSFLWNSGNSVAVEFGFDIRKLSIFLSERYIDYKLELAFRDIRHLHLRYASGSKILLIQVAETRFASHTIVLRRLVRVKEALGQMVISNKWGGWKQADTEKAKTVKDLILSDNFWNRVEYALELTEPIMSMLRYADTDEPCLGNIYDAMDSMLERMKSVIQRREQDPDTLYTKVEKIVLHRWNKMTTPLHLLAYALSPRYYSSEILAIPGRVAPYRDPEVAVGYKRALNRLFSDPDVASNVRREFVDFVSSKNAEPDAINDQSKLDAIGWWYLHGESYMYLQPLAIKILSQVASSSAAERNWSTYSFIHSVKRNRLGSKKAEDLVFIHNNWRLLSRKDPGYKKGPEKLWDVLPETSNLDMTVQDISRIALLDVEEDEDEDVAASRASGTGLGSNDVENVNDIDEDEAIDPSYFDDPFDP